MIDLRDGKISKEEYDDRLNDQQMKRDQVRKSYFSTIFEVREIMREKSENKSGLKEFDADGDKTLSEEELRKVFHDRFLLEPRANFGKVSIHLQIFFISIDIIVDHRWIRW